MALKITLKPNERMIIDGAVVSNGSTTCNLFIENHVPLLREKDIMSEGEADSPCRKIYFIIQVMYLDKENPAMHHNTYWKLVRAVLDAVPSMVGLMDEVNENVLEGKYYRALKLVKDLINYEGELVHVHESNAGIRKSKQGHGFRA